MSRRAPWPAELLLAALAGYAHSQAFAHEGWWWAQLLALTLLAWRVRGAPWRLAGACGLVFGTVWLSCSTWWMYISLHDFGGLAGWMAALAVGLLCALLSLYLAAAMALFARRRRGRPFPDALLFAAVWMLAELARGALFTGFPWAAGGYAHTTGPLATLAPWIGVYGIGFVGAFVAALVAVPVSALMAALSPQFEASPIAAPAGTTTAAATAASTSSPRSGGLVPGIVAAAMLITLGVIGPMPFGSPAGTLVVDLIQTNVAQDEKFAAERMPDALDWLSKTLLESRGDLVVAPETAIPLLPDQLAPEYWQPIVDHFERGRQSALIGLPLGNANVGYTNSVAGISSATHDQPGGFYRYDKHHLVPFGEFIPTGFRWFVELMNIPLGDFNRGALAAPSFAVAGQRVAPNICYEDLFGEELATRFADAKSAPTMFVNISNIAWFGNTVALHQHAEISRMRTIEFQRPMLRSTNTGVTTVIDNEGRTLARLPAYTRGVLSAEVSGREGLTPFARWSAAAGLWPLLLVGLGLVLWPRRFLGATP